MNEHLGDNQRGILSAAQHERLSALRDFSALKLSMAASTTGYPMGSLQRLPEGLAADLVDRRVLCADGALVFETSPRHWAVRLDDGQTLSLAPGVFLPPGRQRLYFLPRSRWVVNGEAPAERWEEYRALVLGAQRIGPQQIEALRAGQIPQGYKQHIKPASNKKWLWLILLVMFAGAIGTIEGLVAAVVLGLVWLWTTQRRPGVRPGVEHGTVAFVDGPLSILFTGGRHGVTYRLMVHGVQCLLAPVRTNDSPTQDLVSVLHIGMPCRMYYVASTGSFVAIEPLI